MRSPLVVSSLMLNQKLYAKGDVLDGNAQSL
jgi:hypothetical protein